MRLRASRDGDHVGDRRDRRRRRHRAAHLPYVFDRFYKADPSRAGGAGTGLGLSIVKAIVERHGGTVRVSSTPGVATSFEVRLPA